MHETWDKVTYEIDVGTASLPVCLKHGIGFNGWKVTDKRSMGTLVYWGWFLLNKNSGTTYILGEK